MRWPWRVMAAAGMCVAAQAMPRAALAAVSVWLETPATHIAPGDTITVDFEVPVADSAFNAFHLVLNYDPAFLTFVPTSPQSDQVGPVMSGACPTLFHQFNAYAGASLDSTVADLSLLCNQTFVTGPGVIYRQKFRAVAGSGVTALSIGASSRVYAAGVVVNPLYVRGTTLVIGNVAGAPVPRSPDGGYRLEAPRPNPLRSGDGATVTFTLPASSNAALELFDLAGRRVAQLDLGAAPAGTSTVRWSAPALPAGHYQIRLRAGGRRVAGATWVILR